MALGSLPSGLTAGTTSSVEVTITDSGQQPAVPLTLSALIRDAGGRARADLHWEDMPLVQGGFQSVDATSSIEGQLYGAHHEEVGGIFERDALIGAFGASR